MRLLARKDSWHEQAPAAMTPHQRMRDFRCCQLPRGPAAGRTRQVGGEQGLLAEVGVRSCPRPEPGGGGQRPGRRSPAACWRGRERNGNHGRSCARSGALACSPVRGPHLRKRRNSLVARLWMLSWGSRGRRFKSGRPDAGQRLDRQSCLDCGDHVDPRGMVWRAWTASQATEPVLHEREDATRLRMGRQLRPC